MGCLFLCCEWGMVDHKALVNDWWFDTCFVLSNPGMFKKQNKQKTQNTYLQNYWEVHDALQNLYGLLPTRATGAMTLGIHRPSREEFYLRKRIVSWVFSMS